MCLGACEDAEKACSIVDNQLPRINRFVLAYLIRFLQVRVKTFPPKKSIQSTL